MTASGRCLLALLLWAPTAGAQALYQSGPFTVTDTSVVEGPFSAVAESPTRIRSTYLYDTARRPRRILYKFALNGRDNEAPPGGDRVLYLVPEDGQLATPALPFGEVAPPEEPAPLAAPLQGTFDVTFRVDLRPVLRAFEEEGAYTPPFGETIRTEDFDGVYVIGSEQPLTWDLNALTGAHRLADPDGDGVYEATLPFDAGGARPFEAGAAVWTLGEAIDGTTDKYPQYRSEQRLVDALYNLSLEELRQLVQPDGTFQTGAKWPGVWTRDISYAILLALAVVEPDVARQSLRVKVDPAGRIYQDTGTGGSWPVSSDRMTWALAAWEVYLATGDEAWLREAHDVIARSVEADLQTVRDPATGLFYGESSFLDWREQSYPRWMDPKDIYLSQTLGTNAVHYRTYQILAQMAERLGEPAEAYRAVAEAARDGINAYLWQADRGYYGQFRYGRNSAALSPRAEALGNALAALFEIANPEQREALLRAYPLTSYGVPTLYPQSPGIPPYHNDSVWPFVVGYWTWAGAAGQNAAAVEHGLGALYRAAALFLTNKENFVASTGAFEGTQVNSDRQLWSVAATLASVYRVLFGMELHPDRLVFRPFVPEPYAGSRTLRALRYRGATLDVTVHGFGAGIASVTLDGEPVAEAVVPADLVGAHTLVITLDGQVPPSEATVVENRFAPDTPHAEAASGALTWAPVDGAVAYEVVVDGEPVATTTSTRYPLPTPDGLTELQVRAVDGRGLWSFLSEPVRVGGDGAIVVQPIAALADTHAGYTGDGYLPLTVEANRTVRLGVAVPEAGTYSIDARYANGSGPVNTHNMGALRTLAVDGERVGTLVMPQRGEGRWDEWGYSNPVQVTLEAGTHVLELMFTPADVNMNRAVNTAHLDHLRLTPLADAAGAPLQLP